MTTTDATGVRGALTVWAARAPRALGDLAYLVYVVLLAALILLGPAVRAVWLLATGAGGRAVLADPSVPAVCIVRARSIDGDETGRREVLVPPSTASKS